MTVPQWLGILLLATSAELTPPSGAGQNSAGLELGKALFEGSCVVCHGFGGTGGEAPNLNRPKLPRAPNDDVLRAVITKGLPPRMPSLERLSQVEMNELVSYVRSLARTDARPVAGNPQKGLELYAKLGCSSCHILEGRGGSFGPMLTEIGAIRAPEHLRQSLLDPGAALPRRVLPPANVPSFADFNEFLPVRVVLRDGREVQGVRVNEDALTIQVRDVNNRFHSFRKDELQRLDKELGRSLMPSYKDRVTASDLDDLVSYLSGLRGTP